MERDDIQQEQYEEALRKLAEEKFSARRFDIYNREPMALRNIENDLLTHFADSGKLKEIIAMSFTRSVSETGHALNEAIRNLMYDDAIEEAKRELETKPSRKPLGDSTVAALAAVEKALAGIKK